MPQRCKMFGENATFSIVTDTVQTHMNWLN